MQWDLGLWGLAVLGAISLGFGAFAALVTGGAAARRLGAAAITTAACLVVGVLTSEGLFGWATEEELQPNVDGLSRDEVLLSGVLTTAVVVLVARHLERRGGSQDRPGDRLPVGRSHGRHER